MPSVQRYLSGRDNLARTAALTASSVRPSTAIERIGAQRAGGGRVRLAGPYTGHEAARIDVEVVSAAGIPRASVPQFVGVGNGTLEALGVDAGAPIQALTLTLADLGVATAHAGFDLREVRIVAKAPGDVGNLIRITVEPHLTRTSTNWALLVDWPVGTPIQDGVQWDFGGLPLNARQELDPASPRIAFGSDPQVYRPWRKYQDGAWKFGLSPALQRNVAADTPVYSVTGGYVITVTDGAVTETFGDTANAQAEIVTFYDMLQALQGSALVEVAGVAAADRVSGGQAAVDVPLRTQAWLASLAGKVTLQGVDIPAGAPTQSLIVRCINDDMVGQERWSVSGAVSGPLPAATTGVPYVSSAATFTVPRIDPAAVGSGRWSFKFSPTTRGDSEGLPAVCLRPFKLGSNAVAKTVTFRYQLRPPPDCNCNDMPTPRLSLKCLGLTEGGDMPLDAEYQSRLKLLYEWRRDFMESNTDPGVAGNYAKLDMDFADMITQALAECLAQIYEVAEARADWDAALLDMQTDVNWLQGLRARPVLTLTDKQGGEPPSYWLNPAQNRVYELLASEMTGAASGSTQVMPGAPGWIDPSDAVWNTSGVSFTTVASYENYSGTVTITNNWRCLSAAEVSDIDARRGAADLSQLLRRYSARMDYVRTLAGILPKSDSSGGDAGGCWIDHGHSAWWADVDGFYLPAFTNEAYISARRDPDTGEVASTAEFGFGLVVACPERLKVGDEITVRIESVDGDKPYRVGDEVVIQSIGAGPAWLTGGVDGTDVQTWRVVGGVSGRLPDYIVPTDGSPVPPYSAAGVQLRLTPGGIPFKLADEFSLAVEAGQYRWRRDGGAWSLPADIPANGRADLADGVAAHFDPGAAPSFVPGDAHQFLVHQPWAASHVRNADAASWGWAGAGATMVLDFGAPQQLGAIGLARYSLPAGAAVSVELSADAVTWSPPEALDVSRAVCVVLLGAMPRYLRLTVANAPDGHIGWLWAGAPMLTDHHASSCERRRSWAVKRGDGINAAGLYAGVGDGWTLGWSPSDWAGSALLEEDLAKLLPMLDWAQERDEPLLFVPHFRHPQDAALVRVTSESLQMADKYLYQVHDAKDRSISATLDLEPVFA